MSRYRLRFLLHELDLPLGATTIGRGTECHVTLDDPLVSRRHARIVVGGDRVVVEDTSSRNGVLLNGARIHGLTRLADGDRIRIGSQDLVFRDQASSITMPVRRATGQLRFCARCHLPYPREVVSCPACEETAQIDEDTFTGNGSPSRPALPLLVEALERALALGRVTDAQRLAQRTAEQIRQLVAAGGSVDGGLLASLAARVADLTDASHDPSWALWVLDVYRETHQIPPVEVVERLAAAGKAASRPLSAAGGAR